MNFNINKEQLKGIGSIAGRIGKSIVIEGTKALILKGAAVAITTSFEEGLGGVKNITLDDVLDGKKKDRTAKSLPKVETKDVVEAVLENARKSESN